MSSLNSPKLIVKITRSITKYRTFATFLFAAISYSFALYAPSFLEALDVQVSEVSILTLSMVFLFVPLIFLYYWALQDFRDDMEFQISQGLDVECVGTHRENLPRLKKDIMSATKVKNTIVGIRDDTFSGVYQKWMSDPENEIWEDVVGIQEFFSDRYHKSYIEGTQHASHLIYVLRDFSHIVNFTILDIPHRGKVVYFGWLSSDPERQSELFLTTDSALVAMFDTQFEKLKKITWNVSRRFNSKPTEGFPISHNIHGGRKQVEAAPKLVDKKGKWITVSYHHEGGDIVLGSIAFVQIDFDVDKVALSASVFRDNGDPEDDFTAGAESTFNLNNVFFSYRLRNEPKTTGICHYKFVRHSKEGRMLMGVFCDSSFKSRNTVVGFETDISPESAKLLSRNQIMSEVKIINERVLAMDRWILDGPIPEVFQQHVSQFS